MNQLIPLDESMEKSMACIDLLIDNRFADAVELSERHASYSLYHSHVHALLRYLKAYFSLEMPDIKKAQEIACKTLQLCDIIRPPTLRDNFVVKLFVHNNYKEFTNEELHAELVRTEQILFGTLLELFADQSLFALVKVSYRLRSTYLTYQSLAKLVNSEVLSSQISQANFKAGVALGQGVFNLIFSLLPERIMSLLSIVGFKGSYEEGVRLLKEAGASIKTFRFFGAQLILAAYECYIDQMFSVHSVKATHTEEYIKLGLQKNSLSIWYLMYQGRISLIAHDIERALREFESGLLVKNADVQVLLHFYHWDTMWTYALMSNWSKAAEFASVMRKGCLWSSASFHYMEAVFLIMDLEERLIASGLEFAKSVEYSKTLETIDYLLSEVPQRVRRYIGRRLPFEKFACEKVIKYERDGRLLCPVYELFLMWNLLIYLEGQERFVGSMLHHIEQCLHYFHPEEDSEDYLLLKLMHGVANRLLGRHEKAQVSLLEVVNKQKSIVDDQHLFCFATLELGISAMSVGEYDQAKAWFIRAKTEINGHPMELFIQFRAHKAFRLLRKLRQQSST